VFRDGGAVSLLLDAQGKLTLARTKYKKTPRPTWVQADEQISGIYAGSVWTVGSDHPVR
jgi:hypothetical protein